MHLETLIERLPAALAGRVRAWTAQPRVMALRDETRLRLGRLIQKVGQGMAEGEGSLQGCTVNFSLGTSASARMEGHAHAPSFE